MNKRYLIICDTVFKGQHIYKYLLIDSFISKEFQFFYFIQDFLEKIGKI